MLAKKLLYSVAFAVAIGFIAGCQSSPTAEQVAEVHALAEEALHTAKAAAQDAAAAKEMAHSAKEMAHSAKACCEANTERMDRMFGDSMMKSK